jgi:hypothetical protein
MPEIVKMHTCRGGIVRCFTAAEWAQLELAGIQGRIKGTDQKALELRICDVCGSCLAVPLEGDDWERHLEQPDDVDGDGRFSIAGQAQAAA